MIFHIAVKDLIITFKDRKALLIMLLMPILIILILGSALGNMFSNDVSVDKFSIAVINNDETGAISKQFVDVITSKDMKKIFNVLMKNENETKALLEKKKVISVITIPNNFSENIQTGKPTKISLESSGDDKIKVSIVESVTNSFVQGISLRSAGINTIIEESYKHNVPLPMDANGVLQTDIINGELEKKLSAEVIKFSEKQQEKNKSISALQYYSAGMLLMFILFGANMGTMLLIEERETRTLGRIMTTGVSKSKLIIGKFLGLLCICLVQATILILFTNLVYGVYWGGNLTAVALVTFCSVFAGAAMGMFIAAISKTQKTAQGLSQLFIQVSTIIGGGMIPIYVMPKMLQHISKVTINFWGTKGYIDLMLGPVMTTVFQYCGILILMGIVYLTIGIKKFRVE